MQPAPRGVTAVNNPVWWNILTPNAEKYESWMRRVVTSFKVKVERARSASGKNPNLRSGAVRHHPPHSLHESESFPSLEQ